MTVYLGIDWSSKSHTTVFVDEAGQELCKATVQHSRQGFSEIDDLRRQLGVSTTECVVGLETAHNLVVDWLWAHGYEQLYVIPPNVTRSRQTSYRQSGARSDASDGYLIGNLLRTECHRLIPWRPDSALTQRLRAKVRLRTQLVGEKVRLANQLRQTLQRYYPLALELFGLDSYIALDFIQGYPTCGQAQALSWAEFEAFARAHHYPRQQTARAYARMQAPQPVPLAATELTYQEEAILRAQMLAGLLRSLTQVEKEIERLFTAHPDSAIFASLPGLGASLAPALLVKFGDDRDRFPRAATVQALAGTAPVTEQSGKWRTVRFRHACDHEFRHYAQMWAKLSLRSSPWAIAYFDEARQRGLSFNHACRALANRWLAILWKLWQSRQPYDAAIHLAQTHLFRKMRR